MSVCLFVRPSVRLCPSLSVCLCLSVSMHSHSFQDTELKLYRYVNESSGQVVEGFKISGVLGGRKGSPGDGHTYKISML